MKPKREHVAWTSHRTEGLVPPVAYRDCAFRGCKQPPVEGLDFPLCPSHCQMVYLTVKGMIKAATPDALAQATDGRRKHLARGPNVLASKRIGTIYFVRLGNLIKIGYTTNLQQRLGDLRRDHHREPEVLATMPGTMGTEKALHAKFGPLWERGELFRPGPDLLDYIKSIPA
jgi:hypothetical protein